MIVLAPEMQPKKVKVKKVKGFVIKKEHKLLDHLKEFYKFGSDAAIASLLDTTPPVISRIRNGSIRMNATLILSVYDATKMPIEKIRELLNA